MPSESEKSLSSPFKGSLTVYGAVKPTFAIIVMRMCSFELNGPLVMATSRER